MWGEVRPLTQLSIVCKGGGEAFDTAVDRVCVWGEVRPLTQLSILCVWGG